METVLSLADVRDGYPRDLNIWNAPTGYDGRDVGPEFARLGDAVRALQDTYTAAIPPPAVAAQAAATIERVLALLAEFGSDENSRIAGRRLDLPSRGHTLPPLFHVDAWNSQSVHGRVTFSPFYLGRNGAAHGGALSLFFDEVLGRLANVSGRRYSRTAYLRLDFRSVTPVSRELTFTGRFEQEDGRKRVIAGELRDGPRLLVEATGLFVELKPGQP